MKKLTREEVFRQAEAAAKDWQKEYATPEKVRGQVRGLLQEKFTNLVAQALGFSCSWGQWEIRHNWERTPLAEAIQEAARRAVVQLLGEPLPTLSEKDVAGLRKAYEEGLRSTAREIAEERGQAAAEALVDAVMADVLASKGEQA